MTKKRITELAGKLNSEHSLTLSEYEEIIDGYSEETAKILAEMAVKARETVYGNKVFIRGLIEVSNICKNDCLYCGIRKSNCEASRYRLTKDEILACCREGYELGFRTFVMQGGEDGGLGDTVVCDIIRSIKEEFPDCAVTLSLGERSRESYALLKEAGADRYLLRHETASKMHYEKLHPESMSFDNRMECLKNLKELGYQVGCGFMVGSPYQTSAELAQDLKFIEEFRPAMCGIGPFIPHDKTSFRKESAGSVEMTCYLLSILRIMIPELLLPATTALGTMDSMGREKGMMAGANVVMPNLSPEDAKKNYTLYNNKLHSGAEAAQNLAELREKMKKIDMEIVTDRGDAKIKNEIAERKL